MSRETDALRGNAAGGQAFYAGRPSAPDEESLGFYRSLAVPPVRPQPSASGGQEGIADSQPGRTVSAVQYAAGRAFYWQGGKWIDSLYDGKKEAKKVPAFSEEYFALLQKQPEIKAVLALAQVTQLQT